MQPDADLEKLAVLIVVNCFRNTVLEQYHCEWPQFTDEKIKALMKEAVDRTYTALCGLFKPDSAADCAALQDALAWHTPAGCKKWDRPRFDQRMLNDMDLAKKLNGKLPGSAQSVRFPTRDDAAT